MRRVQYQRKPFGPKQCRDRFPSLVGTERRIRRAKTGDYLKAFGSRPERKRREDRRAA